MQRLIGFGMRQRPGGAKAGDAGEKVSFEKAMDRLEKIVGDMETGELSLDDMILRFDGHIGFLHGLILYHSLT